ncbi:D-2-hydroxyacid dehydrogenase [Isobaculum melis]|uniref:D-lactate dehydrogenase n=1 Tax=Isobaculum melis TaxID=142588 RepID=A0A1H9SL86_9LACT|nr:D-2-hydroxyacid dehydrogenase [Isobaculum melis]SER85742.1 D-lactate dehydrogenase [Isobaculum melis]
MKILAYNVRADEAEYVKAWAAKNQVTVDMNQKDLTPETVKDAQDYDGVCALQTSEYDPEVYTALMAYGIPQLAIRSAGFDGIDVAKAKATGLKVTNVPAYSSSAIAEFSVQQALQLIRETPAFAKNVQAQDFRWNGFISKELNQLTVGVIGTGRIGKSAIDIYRGFGSKIVAYDLYPNEALKPYVTYVDNLSELYAVADIITLHAPATAENHHLICQDSIAQMKNGVYIVNTARGSLIQTADLIAGLDNGKIAGAALDTYENEADYFGKDWSGKKITDPILQELLHRDDVIVTPHVAFYTETAVNNMVDISLDSVKEVLETGSSRNEIY